MLPVPYIVRRTWTVFLIFQSLMICIWGDCGPPPVIQHTLPVTETSGVPGKTIVYVCDRSTGYYDIPGQGKTLTCQDNNTWSSVPEFCARSCGAPEILSFAKPKASDLEREIFPLGTKLSYECKDGYRRAPGSSNVVTCLDDYTWFIPSDFCERKSCGHPGGDLANGDLEAPDGFLFGSRVTYKCNDGYRLTSKRNYQDCRADGTWSNAVPECQAAICPAPDRPVGGTYSPEKDEYSYLDAVTFKCNNALAMDGSASASCTSEGTWSEHSPTCKVVECQDPGDIQHGRKDSGFVGPYTLNSAVNYVCNDNFALNSSGSITCTIDSQWEPAIPKCLTFCDAPPKPHYAEQEPTTSLKHFDQTTVSYKCKAGYVADPTKANNITCTGRRWSTLAMLCSPISCGNPGTVMHAEQSGLVFTFGSKVSYSCQKGYEMTSSTSYRECQANGKWSDGEIICSVRKRIILRPGEIVGIVLGCVAALFLGFLAWCMCSKKKSGNPKSETPDVQYTACTNA